MHSKDDPVFDHGPIVHKFEVIEGGEDVPQCALECRPMPNEAINPKLCLYQFFAMVDDTFSTVAFGKNEACFHVAFKPDDWDEVQSKYPTGTTLQLEMYPIGPEVSSADNPDVSFAGHGTSESGEAVTRGTSGALSGSTQANQEEVDVDGLKNLINEIVDEMTEPISQKMDKNKLMIEEILSNQTERYESLPNMIKQEIEHHREEERGAAIPNDTQTAGACKCIIS